MIGYLKRKTERAEIFESLLLTENIFLKFYNLLISNDKNYPNLKINRHIFL